MPYSMGSVSFLGGFVGTLVSSLLIFSGCIRLLLNPGGSMDGMDRPGIEGNDGSAIPVGFAAAVGFGVVKRLTNRGTIALKLFNSMPSNCSIFCVKTNPLFIDCEVIASGRTSGSCSGNCNCGNGVALTSHNNCTSKMLEINEINFIFFFIHNLKRSTG